MSRLAGMDLAWRRSMTGWLRVDPTITASMACELAATGAARAVPILPSQWRALCPGFDGPLGDCMARRIRGGESYLSYYSCASTRLAPDKLTSRESRHVERRAKDHGETPVTAFNTLSIAGWEAADRTNTWSALAPIAQNCVRDLIVAGSDANSAGGACWATGATTQTRRRWPAWLGAVVAAVVVVVVFRGQT